MQEAQLRADLIGAGALRLQGQIGPRKAVPVSAERGRLAFQRRAVRVGTRVLPGAGIRGPQLPGDEARDPRKGVRENEAGGDG